MTCPMCGNEVSQEEAFCGQCGTPSLPSAPSTHMGNTAPARSGRLNATGFYTQHTNMPSPYNTGSLLTPEAYNPLPGRPMRPNPPTGRLAAPQQGSAFYQDATEAISALPGTNGQQNIPGVSM